MTSRPEAWRRELLWCSGWFLLAILIGRTVDAPWPAFSIALALYASWHVYQLVRLHEWLTSAKRGEPPEASGIWSDIFETFYELENRNNRRERRLSDILGEFRASTAALPDGAVVLDRTGQIVWFNDAAQSMLGLRRNSDIGQRVANLLRHPQFIRYIELGRYEEPVEAPSPVNDELILQLRIIPYGDGQRLLIARDVSQRKQLEATRRDFVANASHELRTPLTVLQGYLDMMREDAAENGPLKAWSNPIGEMREQASRMGNIIHDLLILARLESDGLQGAPEVLDVADMLRRIALEAESTIRASHTVQLDIDEGLLLHGRQSEVHSVFSNLIFNAFRYTPSEGEIHIAWKMDGEEACFSVRDTGIGIPTRDIPRVTERFYRVDAARSRRSGGTGLGLAIAKHALERHEGRLHIASEPNVGSEFTCRFPLHRVRQRNVVTKP